MVTRRHLLLAALGGTAGFALPRALPALAASRVPLPRPVAWRAHAGDVDPRVKLQATRLVESVGNWGLSGGSGLGAGSPGSARARAAAAGFTGSLADSLTAFTGAGTANVVRVRMAQYGGILTNSASVLLVVDSWRANADGTVTAGGTTLDVRLVRASPRWRVIDVFPATPLHAQAKPSALGQQLLDDDHLRLPYSARADVLGGGVQASVLRFLRDLSAEHLVDVSIMQSGHPTYVFGTSRLSDHPRGRAVDVWALAGRPLALPSNHALAAQGMRLAVAHGAYNVGGPVQLRGAQYFSDRTHQDHIHLGFRG